MSVATDTLRVETYIDVVPVAEMFPDRTYQRELDTNRARHMAKEWDRRLVGVIDVSDRGADQSPRYAIINGQHRWSAAGIVDPAMQLAANVHTGLTVEDEAKLFFDIDAKTKQLTNWDRWYARRASGDPTVTAIEKIVNGCGLAISHNPGAKNIQCCSAIERIWNNCAPEVLADTLILVLDVWPDDPDAKKSGVLEGVALVLSEYAHVIENGRLGDAMSDLTPRQLQVRARDLQERGQKGRFPKLIGRVLVHAYNKRQGRGRLDPEVLA